MPQIPVILSKETAPGPINQANADPSAFGAIGRGLQGLGGGLQQAADNLHKMDVQKDMLEANAALAQAHVELTKTYADDLSTADPNDPEWATKFETKVSDRLSGINVQLRTNQGRAYLEQQSQDYATHFAEKAIQGQIDLAGAAAKQNYLTAVNSFTSALATDPSSFGFVVKQMETSLDNMTGLTAEQKLQLKSVSLSEAAKSAAMGWIDKSPAAAEEIIKSGAYDKYIDGTTKASLLNAVDTAKRAADADVSRDYQIQQRARAEADRTAQVEWMQQITTDPQSVKLEEIAKDGRLEPESMRVLINAVKGDSDKPNAMTPDYYHDMQGIIDNKINDQNYILQQVANGKYSMTRAKELLDVLNGKRTPEGTAEASLMKSLTTFAYTTLAKPDPVTGLVDIRGQQTYLAWQAYFLSKFNEAKAAGKSGTDLLNPASPDYLGGSIAQYAPTAAQQIDQLQEEARRAADDLAAARAAKAGGAAPAPKKSLDEIFGGK